MGVVSSNFKATVTFGGVVSSSFKSSSETLTSGIQDAETAVSRLTKKQEMLSQQIKKGVLAGKDVSKLKRQYTDLSKSIEDATQDAEKLNRALMMRKAWTVPLSGAARMGGAGLSAAMGNAGLISGAFTGAVGGFLAINAATAEQAGIAKSYGVNLSTFKAWDSLGKQIGLDGEAMGDLAEELANKVGEFKVLGEQSSVSDAFTGLGLTMKDLAGKTNEQQMALILDRAAKIEDQQVARSMIDMIMGGEGNKILTYMRESGKTYQGLIDAQKKYILTTEEGVQGAVRGQMAFSNLWVAISSASQEVVGVLADELAPSITKYADEFADWFRKDGKEIMVDGVMDFALGIRDFWNGQLQPVLSSLWKGLKALAEFLDKWIDDEYETEFSRTDDEGVIRQLANKEWDRLNPNASMFDLSAMHEKKAYEDEQVTRKRLEISTRGTTSLTESTGQFSINQRFLDATNTPAAPQEPKTFPALIQRPSITVVVQAADGNNPEKTADIVVNKFLDIFKSDAGGNAMMTPPSLGG